jgi:hypothetical protein
MQITRFSRLAAVALATGALAACSSDSNDVTPPPAGPRQATLSGSITANRTLSKDTTYVLSGFVYVQNGATLTIPAGTRIVGDTLVPGSALFVLRGARIEANGTAAEPIVFTSQRAPGFRSPGDWGGLIIVGNAPVNRTGSVIIEGSNASIPGGNGTGVVYSGGNSPNDNSGTLRFVRVEFAGYAVSQDNELNSFTFASVGRGTTLEYLEALAGLDDHFEWFGGTADARYLVSYESGDDHFDAAEGFNGRVQYLIGFQSTILQPRPGTGSPSSDPQGFEIDGCAGTGCTAPAGGNAQSSEPYNMPVFANFTLVGTGDATNTPSGGGRGAVIRRGTGGVWLNGVFARWPRHAVSLRDSTTRNRYVADSLAFRGIYLTQNGTAVSGAQLELTSGYVTPDSGEILPNVTPGTATTQSLFTAFPTTISVATNGASFDWQPAAGSPITTGGTGAIPAGRIASRLTNFFGGTLQGTTFRGAADPAGPKWWAGWTSYARN